MSIKKFIITYYRVVLANLRSRHWLGTIYSAARGKNRKADPNP